MLTNYLLNACGIYTVQSFAKARQDLIKKFDKTMVCGLHITLRQFISPNKHSTT